MAGAALLTGTKALGSLGLAAANAPHQRHMAKAARQAASQSIISDEFRYHEIKGQCYGGMIHAEVQALLSHVEGVLREDVDPMKHLLVLFATTEWVLSKVASKKPQLI
jgi:hypothetical protein